MSQKVCPHKTSSMATSMYIKNIFLKFIKLVYFTFNNSLKQERQLCSDLSFSQFPPLSSPNCLYIILCEDSYNVNQSPIAWCFPSVHIFLMETNATIPLQNNMCYMHKWLCLPLVQLYCILNVPCHDFQSYNDDDPLPICLPIRNVSIEHTSY